MFTERQTEIIESSIALVSELGIQGLTIKNISRKIGISEPAIYRHFTGKGEILTAILEYYRLLARHTFLQTLSDDDRPMLQLRKIFHAQLELFIEKPSLLSVIFAEEIFRNEQSLASQVSEIMRNKEEIISRLLELGQAVGEIRKDLSVKSMTLLIMGAMRLLATRWHLTANSFSLQSEGEALLQDIEKMLSA